MVKAGDKVKLIDATNLDDLYEGQEGYVAGSHLFPPPQGVLIFFQPDDRDSKIYPVNPRRLEKVE